MEILKADKQFKEAVGAFIISFSELESGLARLGVFTISDPRKYQEQLPNFISHPLSKKREVISEYIKLNLPDLISEWEVINSKIGALNRFRRFVVHGIIYYPLPRKSVKSYIKENGKLVEYLLTSEEILEKKKELIKLRTGNNGIEGEFREKFIVARLNIWNKLVKKENKFVYKINDEVKTD